MAERKNKMTREAVKVPKTKEELNEFLRKLSECHQKIQRIQLEANRKINNIRAEASEQINPLQKEVDSLFEGIFIFAQAHQNELTNNGKNKTVNFPNGTIFWRKNPPSVFLRNVKEVINFCKEKNLLQFLRVKAEVNKEAMLADPETASKIKGVKIVQKEEFGVKLPEGEFEISKTIRKTEKRKV